MPSDLTTLPCDPYIGHPWSPSACFQSSEWTNLNVLWLKHFRIILYCFFPNRKSLFLLPKPPTKILIICHHRIMIPKYRPTTRYLLDHNTWLSVKMHCVISCLIFLTNGSYFFTVQCEITENNGQRQNYMPIKTQASAHALNMPTANSNSLIFLQFFNVSVNWSWNVVIFCWIDAAAKSLRDGCGGKGDTATLDTLHSQNETQPKQYKGSERRDSLT